MQKCYIKGTRILFCKNYYTININVFCTLKIAETLNLKILVRFSFLQLRNIKEAFSEYF